MTSLLRRLLASLGVVLLLAACTTAGEPADDPTSPHANTRTRAESSGRPAVGDCWQEDDYVTAGTWDHWQGASPVDCQTPHNTITYAVVDLPTGLQLSSTARAADGQLTVVLQLAGLCTSAYQEIWSANRAARSSFFYYQPSPAQVNAGQRWVRCDAAIHALGPISAHKWEALPATIDGLKAALAADPVRYQWCLNTPSGPDVLPQAAIHDGSAVTVSCDGPSQWEMAKTWKADLDHAPSQAEAMAILTPVCSARMAESSGSRTGWYGYAPSPDEWQNGDRTMTCWLYQPQAATSTT